MYNFLKLTLITLSLFAFSSTNNKSYAVAAETVKECSSDTHLFTGSATACRFTPQLYKANVYEISTMFVYFIPNPYISENI